MRLKPDELLYIKSELRNMHVFTVRESFVTSGIRLNDIEQNLPSFFVRCHKSYVVNMHHVRSFDKTTATILLDTPHPTPLPVGRKFIEFINISMNGH